MKAHPKLTRKGNVCLTVTSVDRPRGIVAVEVTDHSMSTSPELVGRIYNVDSLVTLMTVRFPIEGTFDWIQHHQIKSIVELEVGDKINAIVFHDEALKEIIIVSVAEEHFLRNELKRFGNSTSEKKPQPKKRHQAAMQRATKGNTNEEVTSSYDLEQAFRQNGADEQDSVDDDGPIREDVILFDGVEDIRKGNRHRQLARRHRQQDQQSQAA